MNISEDKISLINYSIDFAEKMLNENQEFYPFASTINLCGEHYATALWEGDDHPSSKTLLDNLEIMLEKQINLKEKRAYALVYDVKVQKENSGRIFDAIAIKLRHTEAKEITIYYYAYKMNTQNTIEHLESWAEYG